MQVDQVCARGHDLTVANAFVYSASGLRSCRLCSEAAGGKPRRRGRFKDETTVIGRWSG